jgi:hypothetical protein
MNRTLIAIGSWVLIAGLVVSCGKDKNEDDKPVNVIPDVLPIPSRGPELTKALPVDGYTVKDVASQYCSVILTETNEELLIGSVESLSASDEEKISFSVYFPLGDRGFIEKSSYSSAQVKSSTCDMAKLAKEKPLHLALAPISVYADPSLKGDAVCTFPAGSTLVSDGSYDPISNGALPFFVPNGFDCKGLNRGYLYEWPVIVTVYQKI